MNNAEIKDKYQKKQFWQDLELDNMLNEARADAVESTFVTCDFCDAYDVKGYHIKALDKAELRICQNCFDMPSTVKTKLESEYRASERARIALEIKQGIESGYHKTDEHGEDDIFSCCEDCVEGSEEGIASCPCWQAFWEKYLPDAKKEE